MYELMHEQLNQPADEILRYLSEVPLTEELAPGVEPGEMPFLKRLHANQREQLDFEYRSSTLTECDDPATKELSFSNEASMYFQNMASGDFTAAAFLADQLPDTGRIPRTSVCLPVATHEEGRNLYRALEHYVHQTLPTDQFEIFLFLNRPALGGSGEPTDDLETLQALADFKRDYPGALNISEAYAVFDEPLNLGELKKLHFDAHMLRCLRAGIEDPIIVMNDADMVDAPEAYLERYVRYFDESTLVDAVVGEFDLDHGAYVKYPFVHVANRLHGIISAIKGNSAKRIVNSNNTAMRGSAYCALGGNTKMRRSSDSYMGVVMTDLRQTNDTVLRPQHPDITSQTSARRVVAAWLQGYAPNEKWRLNLGAHNADVRQLPDGVDKSDKLFDLADEDSFNFTLEYAINRLIANYESEDDEPLGWDSVVYQRALSLLGISYTLHQYGPEGNILRITGTPELRSALIAFRQNYLAVSETSDAS